MRINLIIIGFEGRVRSKDAITSYLKPGRLADVLALIQVLAYHRGTDRSETGLNQDLQRKPSEGESWMALAKEHPEFFRVRNDPNQKRVALLSRYVLDYRELPDGHEKRPTLNPSITNKLMELAIELHDKQLERKNRWKNLIPIIIPMVVALIAATAAIYAAIINTTKPIAPAVAQQVAPADRQQAGGR